MKNSYEALFSIDRNQSAAAEHLVSWVVDRVVWDIVFRRNLRNVEIGVCCSVFTSSLSSEADKGIRGLLAMVRQ